MMEDYSKLFSLEGKKALVTGGTSGLGYAIAQAFLQQGADVAVCGGHPEKAQGLVSLAEEYGRTCLAIRCDIRCQGEIDQMLDGIQETFRNLDILVNSAGMNKRLPAETYDEASFRQVMDLNVTALHLVTSSVGRRFLIPGGGGKIINLSSVKGLIGTGADYAAYCASKGAVGMYTKQLACEWGKYHITTNAIAPTFVRTPINASQLDDPVFYQKLLDRIPLGRIGQERDVASAALYLAGAGGDFVNGHILVVDGGLTSMQ